MISNLIPLTILLIALPDILYGITTIHHDKPEKSRISSMATAMKEETINREATVYPERHKRLLPYINYYYRKNTHPRYTPFLESNALPGPFIPIVKPTSKNIEVTEKSPNYAAIYDTLMQLKQNQQAIRYNLNTVYRKPVNYVPLQYYQVPSKTTIETFTPIDIDLEDKKKYEYEYKPKIANSKPLVVEFHQTEKPKVNTIVEEQYTAQKLIPVQTPVQKDYVPVQFITEKPTRIQFYSSTTPHIPNSPHENTNILAKILKQLQSSNTLPQTLTPQNIDNSIRTLVKILNGLRKEQGLNEKPIIVEEESSEEEVTEKPYVPDPYTQVFPANTIDGGTPGRPGIDYPALSSIPQTDFNCKKQRYKGFFGDPHTNCQVWHYCDLNGGQASFLCPNGTIFSQVALTCDWWYNVKCSSTAQLYVLNERLYKYILPLAPKFPEDYSGPLVDRYLALKFQEMEEKMKNDNKKDDKSEEEKDDSDQLQDIRDEKRKAKDES